VQAGHLEMAKWLLVNIRTIPLYVLEKCAAVAAKEGILNCSSGCAALISVLQMARKWLSTRGTS
jgi:hypothetical protein